MVDDARQEAGEGLAAAQSARASRHERLLSSAFAAALDCVIVMDGDGVVVELNAAAERTFGYQREEALGRELAELLIPPALREHHRRGVRELRHGQGGRILGRRVELTGMRADGSEFPVELTVTALDGEPQRYVGFVRDVTERRRAAEAQDLLATAGATFDTSLDPRQTMRTIAHTAVPRLAELCVLDLIGDDGRLGDAVAVAVDQRLARRLEELRVRERLDLGGSHPVALALRSGAPVVVDDLAAHATPAHGEAGGDAHTRLLVDAGYRSAVAIRLTARGRLLGALSFVHAAGGGHRVEHDHLALMQDLAARAAMALDNANLYAERVRVARMLQRSLLPEALPTLAGVQLASVYRPVGAGGEVGGDFYDVFDAPTGSWLAVGDVCGKGPGAAAITAIVRHSIRALAFHCASPAHVLADVNDVMRSHELAGRFATAVLARLDHSASPARAVLASAGHPSPLLLDAAGAARRVPVAGALLGVLAQPALTDVEVTLEAGATLILYTDGLTDAGAPTRELSAEDLCRELTHARDASPRALLSRLEGLALACGRGHLRDDVAILAARVTA